MVGRSVPAEPSRKGGVQIAKEFSGSGKQSFQDVRSLHAAVDLSGTLARPKWKLKTNLGPQLAAGLKSSLRRELAGRQEQLAAQLQHVTDQQLASFSKKIAARQQELLAKLNLGEQEIAQLQQLITELPRLSDAITARYLIHTGGAQTLTGRLDSSIASDI